MPLCSAQWNMAAEVCLFTDCDSTESLPSLVKTNCLICGYSGFLMKLLHTSDSDSEHSVLQKSVLNHLGFFVSNSGVFEAILLFRFYPDAWRSDSLFLLAWVKLQSVSLFTSPQIGSCQLNSGTLQRGDWSVFFLFLDRLIKHWSSELLSFHHVRPSPSPRSAVPPAVVL